MVTFMGPIQILNRDFAFGVVLVRAKADSQIVS